MVEEPEEEKYRRFAERDPFPDIPATLLQSGHIWSYVLKTGMISPFEPLSLKPATYEVKLGGKCVIFDEEGKRTTFFLGTNPSPEYPGLEARSEIVLVRNSIVFLTLYPFFRLPYYIAARFNLKIKNVYRGLLLGTGPIVDPGFHGRLSLPLHNLTNNRYVYSAGEPFAWFEFTKTSWRPTGSKLGSRTRSYSSNTSPYTPDNLYEDGAIEIHQPFPQEKLRRHDISDYLDHANGGMPVQSSLPPVLTRVERLTRTTERRLIFLALLA